MGRINPGTQGGTVEAEKEEGSGADRPPVSGCAMEDRDEKVERIPGGEPQSPRRSPSINPTSQRSRAHGRTTFQVSGILASTTG